MTPASLGPRQAAVLAHLDEHPGLTAGELERFFGLRHSLLTLLRTLEQKACVVAVTAWEPAQGRRVSRWHIAPPGTAPPPPPPPPDPRVARRRRELDRLSQRARRAARRGLIVQPGVEAPSLRSVPAPGAPVLPGAACRGEDPDLFFAPEAEPDDVRQARVAKAKAICAGCPARAACLDWALNTRQAFGLWGGTDEAERRAMLRAQTGRRAS